MYLNVYVSFNFGFTWLHMGIVVEANAMLDKHIAV
jgi:hypothetical protein